MIRLSKKSESEVMFCYSFSDCVREGSPIGVAKYTQTKSEKLHTHSFTEIVYIVKGNAVHYVDGIAHNATAGSLIYIKPYSSHEIKTLEKTTYIDIYCKCDKNDDLQGICFFEGDLCEQLEAVLNAMYIEYVTAGVSYEDIINSYLIVITRLISRVKQLNESNNRGCDLINSAQHMKSAQILQEIASSVRSNPQNTLTLQELAEKYHYSASYLSRKFTALFGISYTAYVYRQRFQRVCYLIETTDSSVESLLQEYNISDISRFYRDFKAKFYITPQQYRLSLGINS